MNAGNPTMKEQEIDDDIPEVASAGSVNTRQQLFVRYLTAVLIDLAVLNLFDEYWRHVTIDSFSVSMLAALLLQILLRLTLAIEHRIAAFFHGRPGLTAKFMRVFSAWVVLFSSKVVMLGAIGLVFGSSVVFAGPFHGVIAFIAVVVAMLIAEEFAVRINRRLA
jgi:hypothetical protein